MVGGYEKGKGSSGSNVIIITIIIIIIIINSSWQHIVPLHSLAIRPYHPSLLATLLDCIQYLHRADALCNILKCRCMQKHIQHNKDERTQFFWKIYLSLYSKGFEMVTKGIICERWVGDWTELQHIDLRTLLTTAAFLSRSPGLLNRGPGGLASAGTWFSFQHLSSNWSELPEQLTVARPCVGFYLCVASLMSSLLSFVVLSRTCLNYLDSLCDWR